MSVETWNDQNIEELKRLWTEGNSASQCAAILGIKSRNAVIGKIHRLGLKRGEVRSKSIARANVAANAFVERKKRAKVRQAASVEPPLPVAVQVPSKAWEPLAGIEAVTIMGLRSASCRWPVEIDGAVEQHFCGALKIGGVYCVAHTRMHKRKSQPAFPADHIYRAVAA